MPAQSAARTGNTGSKNSKIRLSIVERNPVSTSQVRLSIRAYNYSTNRILPP